MTITTSTKSKFFTDYQRMLSFTINLCYKGKDFVVSGHANGWTVRYQ